MKRMSMAAASLLFAAIFAVSASAQTAPQKIVVIDSGMFGEEKVGITKFLTAASALDKEFAGQVNSLRTDRTRYEALQKELRTIQDQINAGSNVPINQSSVQAKSDEYAALEITLKRKSEDLEKAIGKRQAEIFAPLERDIFQAMQEFATKNGYDYIFDRQRVPPGMLLTFNAKNDVTKDFITFYNSRVTPAASTGTASTGTRP